MPELRRRHGVVATGLIMGLLWGTWHLPMFAGTRDPQGVVPAVVVVAAWASGGRLTPGHEVADTPSGGAEPTAAELGWER